MVSQRLSLVALVAGALCAHGCGASLANDPGMVGPQGPYPAGAGPSSAPWGSRPLDWEHPSPPVAAALGAADRALTSAGFTPIAALRAGFLLPTSSSTMYTLRVDAGRCYAVLAVGELSVNDVDLYVFDARNAQVAVDREVDPHPSVRFCAPYPGELFVRVHMYAGQGPVHLRAYASSTPNPPDVQLSGVLRGAYLGAVQNPAGADAIAQGSAGAPPEAGPSVGAPPPPDGAASGAAPAAPAAPSAAASGPAPNGMDANTLARLASVRARLAPAGYTEPTPPVSYLIEPGRSREVPMRLEAGHCYSFATLGGPGVTDSDVFVTDGSRRDLINDTRTEVDALVTDLCPTRRTDATVRVRLYAGVGPVWLASFVRRGGGPSRVAANSATAPAPREPNEMAPMAVAPSGPAVPGEPGVDSLGTAPVVPPANPQVVGPPGVVADDTIERNWAVLAQTMSGLGLRPVGAPIGNQLAPGLTTANPVRLAAGRCYAFALAFDAQSQGMALALFDAQGNSLGDAQAPSSTVVLRACPRREGVHSLRVRMGPGGGRYRLGLYEQPR